MTLKNKSEARMRNQGMGPFSTLCSSLFHHLPPLQLLVTVYHSTNIRHTNSAGTSRGITASAVTFCIGACYGEARTGAPCGSSNLPRAPRPRTACPAAGGTSPSGDRSGGTTRCHTWTRSSWQPRALVFPKRSSAAL